ncbi:MAG: peptidoglycan DD-metalloendopeptidase family protein [Eubacterium sp.]|nr:peptidoglycan DD-metalloendopeptidase family protein [Eubacterium sp.]
MSVYADEPEGEEDVSVTSTTAATTHPTSAYEPRTIDEKTTQETTENNEKAKKRAQKTLEQQKKELKKMLEENSKKLEQFSKSADDTEAYINALDERIGFINEELNVLDKEIAQSQKKVDELNKQIEPLEKELKNLQKQFDKEKKEYDKLQNSFNNTYDAYCLRMRALYISGNASIIAALLTSEDISQFFSRLEMIKAVAKSDTALLKEVNSKMDEIVNRQDGLNQRKAKLTTAQGKLNTKRNQLKGEQDKIISNQKEIAAKKIQLADDRAESDRLFAEYAKQAMIYTEFRNEDEEIIKQVNSEIDALLSGLKDPSEVTTAANPEHNADDVTGDYEGDGDLFAGSNAALSLCYPVPGHTGVSCPFGHYSNGRPHTGTDFPCPVGSKVVAAQKGIVITVKRLNYSYGYYVMVYHGTDAKGRKIVTLYAHNSSILVSVGQTVKKGQQIAKSGSTGNSTGPHCHFEVIIDGSKVNPKNYLG